jgi:hypothetical protein
MGFRFRRLRSGWGVHLGNRKGLSKERTANVAGVEIQLRLIATPLAIII